MHIELGLDSLRTPFSVTSVVPGLGQSKRTSGKRWRKQANPRCTGQCHSSPQHSLLLWIRRICPWSFYKVHHCCRSWLPLYHRLFWSRSWCIYPFHLYRSFLCCCLLSVRPSSKFYLSRCNHSTWGHKLKWNMWENEYACLDNWSRIYFLCRLRMISQRGLSR